MNKKISELLTSLKAMGCENNSKPIIDAIKDGATGPILVGSVKISDDLRYHIDNNIPITETVFRRFSSSYFSLLKESRELFESGELIVCADSEWMLLGNIGKFAEFEGQIVPLDAPMELEKEEFIIKSAAEYKGKKVNIGKPRSLRKGEPGHGRKQNVVYVMDGDKVKRIVFGDPNLKAKPEHSKNRKSFRARHKCDQKKDKTTPGYWACRYPPNW
jgi:hypothetical protein